MIRPTRPADAELAVAYRAAGHWPDRTVGEAFDRCVRERPHALAFSDGSNRLTYAELDRRVRRVAAFLSSRGVGRGDVVSYQLPNGLAAFVSFFATLRIGAVTNPIVPIYRGRELRHILAEAETRVAILPVSFRDFDYVGLYRRLRSELETLTDLVVIGESGTEPGEWTWDEVLDGEWDGAEVEPAVDPDDIALLLYTSGTTSMPKGVLHSHNTIGFEAQLMADWARLDERDVILSVSPVTHATGILNGHLVPVFTCGRVAALETWDAEEALALVAGEGVTYAMFATPFLRGLLAAADAGTADASSLRWIGCGGADIPVELMRAATERLCPNVVRVYGASEGFTVTSTTTWDAAEKRVRTDGRWLGGYEGRTIDEAGAETPAGVEGEVCWRGAGMFLGFLDPALNDGAFTADGFYRSGDLGILDEDGYLTITGRLKDVINRSGEKIGAHEVEQLLAGHPAIREVAVVAQPDPITGERGCAWVVPEPGASPTLADLAGFLIEHEVAKQKLPEDLGLLEQLPKTPAGKIRKNVLREMARDRVAAGEPKTTAGSRT